MESDGAKVTDLKVAAAFCLSSPDLPPLPPSLPPSLLFFSLSLSQDLTGRINSPLLFLFVRLFCDTPV